MRVRGFLVNYLVQPNQRSPISALDLADKFIRKSSHALSKFVKFSFKGIHRDHLFAQPIPVVFLFILKFYYSEPNMQNT